MSATTSLAAPFAIRDYSRLQFARVATVVATQAQGTAVAWDVLERSHRPLELGLVGLAQFLPIALTSLVAGQAADRLDRRRLLATVFGIFALVSGALFLYARSGARPVWPIFLILFLHAGARSFGQPASSALLPDIVPTELFEQAVALGSSMWQIATVVGPVIGGVLVAWLGTPAVFVVAGVLSTISAVLVARIERQPTRARERGVTLESLLAGVRYVWSHELILGAITLDLFAVLLGGATALLPVFADLLHTGSWGLGLLRAAPGVGAALSGLSLARRRLERHAGPIMFACVAGFGVATVGFALSRSFVLSFVMLFLTGATDMVSVVIRQTLLQLKTPAEMRGRVSAVNLVFVGASNELGEFESGLTAQWWTAPIATLVGGVGTLAVVAIAAVVFPELRRVDRLREP